MKKISFLLFLLPTLFSFSQNNEKITVKQQNQIFFYRIGDYKDSTIIKDSSDIFLVKLSSDKKAITEIRLKNATFVKTNDEHIFKLIYTPGTKYHLIYPPSTPVNKTDQPSYNESKVEIDGAITDGSKEIVIELVNTKTEKVLLTNVFYWSGK